MSSTGYFEKERCEVGAESRRGGGGEAKES